MSAAVRCARPQDWGPGPAGLLFLSFAFLLSRMGQPAALLALPCAASGQCYDVQGVVGGGVIIIFAILLRVDTQHWNRVSFLNH